MAAIDKEIKILEEGEAWDECDEVVELDVNESIGKIVTFKLSPEKWKELSREASALGVGPGALAATWVQERLRRGAEAKV